ncbi:TetR/AcrR family transcriptional regulator [Actinoalloteichus caeruleus]|uniref:TetR/AcrR family transcriptional regulator n=1 Tax=Actinoalloteichus cyanogriseus TaxID=2893586 RepID=UPI0004AAA24B|nr:TetR/AcrR family transcriptional regulator [Actinoalloteichus caeruleus]
MPRPSAQYEAMRSATLARVHTAATALFTRHGFAATSVRDIAREAGISTGLIYRHYPSKDELFDALVRQATDGLRDAARRLRAEDPPERVLTRFTEDFLSAVAREEGFAEFSTLMNHAVALPVRPPSTGRLMEEHVALLDALVDLVERGQREGGFRPGPPRELAVAYLATLGGLAMMKVSLGAELTVASSTIVNSLVC